MNKKFYIGLLCVVFIIVLYIYWYYIRPRHYEKIYQKLKQFKGFKKSHLTDQPKDEPQVKPITNTNCHFLVYGTSGSGKTSFLKYYLDQTKSNFIVFGRDEREFHASRTKVEDLFRFGRHNNIQVIYLAHYAKDVLPIVR